MACLPRTTGPLNGLRRRSGFLAHSSTRWPLRDSGAIVRTRSEQRNRHSRPAAQGAFHGHRRNGGEPFSRTLWVIDQARELSPGISGRRAGCCGVAVRLLPPGYARHGKERRIFALPPVPLCHIAVQGWIACRWIRHVQSPVVRFSGAGSMVECACAVGFRKMVYAFQGFFRSRMPVSPQRPERTDSGSGPRSL